MPSRARLVVALWAAVAGSGLVADGVARYAGGGDLLGPGALAGAALALLLGWGVAWEVGRRVDPLRRRLLRSDRPPPSPTAVRELLGAPDALAVASALVAPLAAGLAALPGPWSGGEGFDGTSGWRTFGAGMGAAALARALSLGALRPWWASVEPEHHRARPRRSLWVEFPVSAAMGAVSAAMLALGWHRGVAAAPPPGPAVLLVLGAGLLAWLLVGRAVASARAGLRAAARRWSIAASGAPEPGTRSERAGWRRTRLEAVAFMSHDLRAPLNALLGFGELLRTGSLGEGLSPGQREDLEAVDRAARDLLGRVDALLEWARLEMGGRARGQWVVPAELLNDAAREARRLLGAAAPEVRVEVSAGLPPVWTEERAARRAIALAVALARDPGERERPVRGIVLRGLAASGGVVVEIQPEPAAPQPGEAGPAAHLLEALLRHLGATLASLPGGGLRLGPLGTVEEPEAAGGS